MNSEEQSGGSSSSGQENGDGSNGSERPLKKARFAWQVKGKYHLKNENNDPVKISTMGSIAPEDAGPSGSGSNSSTIDNIGSEQNIKTIGGYLLNKDFNVVDGLDKSALNPSKIADNIKKTRSFSPQEEPLKKDFASSQYIPSKYLLANSDTSNSDELAPISWVEIKNYSEDECIARWQARQVTIRIFPLFFLQIIYNQ